MQGFISGMSLEEKEYIKAWKAKAEQVVIKARFAMKDDQKTIQEIEYYANQIL